MTQVTLQNAPDLRTGYPRSPNAILGEFVLLPRIIDKCRAVIAATNGEYNYNCPLDRQFFDFAEVDAEAFQAQVAEGQSDEQLLAWVNGNSKPLTHEEILAWSYTMRWRAPETPEMKAYFEGMRRECVPDKLYVQTWFQLLDADERRF